MEREETESDRGMRIHRIIRSDGNARATRSKSGCTMHPNVGLVPTRATLLPVSTEKNERPCGDLDDLTNGRFVIGR